jgi:D-beta-D-heptose 7-phosphate kinase/D-beta-D-heptose 1-phosphate adenosyltransferase
MSLSAVRARALLRAMRGRRVLVLGDVMLDQFLWGRVARISPEAPVPVVEISSETFHLGGAANVAANVRALGGEAVVAGIVGDDAPGARVRSALAEAGIEDALSVAEAGRPTTVKTRIIAHHQQVVRADRESSDGVAGALERALLDRVRSALPACGAVIVSDYHKGVVTAAVMKAVVALARRRGVAVLVDPKVAHFGLYRRVGLVTPNQLEAEQATGIRIRGEADVLAAGERILRRLSCEAALITRGEHGMSLFEPGRRPVHNPTAAREVFDVTGAGDTVIATIGLARCARASLPVAARLANLAAGVVVGKVGTATASPDEVVAAADAAETAAG